MATTVPEPKKLTLMEEGDIIRAAWSKGKRNKNGQKVCMLPLNGGAEQFVITRRDKKRSVTLGPPLKHDEQHVEEISESWLIARPASGASLPTMCVARIYGANGVYARPKS